MRRLFGAVSAVFLGCAGPLSAGLVDVSPRPELRPEMARDTVDLQRVAMIRSPRPEVRPATARIVPASEQISTSNLGFQRWVEGFRRRAQAQGISASVLNSALRGIRYNTDVIARDRNQSEFTKTIWDYLDSAASPTRVRNGKAAPAQASPHA